MTDSASHTARPAQRAHTLRFQGAANRVARTLLATPGVAHLLGGRLVTLYLVGRKSGRRLTVPVAYTQHDGTILIGTPFRWGRNLRDGEPVQVRYKGRRRWADAEVFTAEDDVVRLYSVMAQDNPAFASFNQIGRDPSGALDANDLRLAWEGGARAFVLTLR